MKIAERFDQSLDEFYAEQERRKERCCIDSRNRRALLIGMRKFQCESAHICDTCETRWFRMAEYPWWTKDAQRCSLIAATPQDAEVTTA